METKVRIYRQPWSDGMCMTILRQINGKTYLGQIPTLEFSEVKEYDIVKPTLQLSEPEARDLFKAMAEEFDNQGIKTDSDAKIAGTLEATREHLKDLQKIVFKERK